MAAEKEQIDNWAKGKHFNRRRAKRDMSKLLRRQSKETLEDAPKKKAYNGYTY